MMKAPTDNEIMLAEQRISDAKRDFSLARARANEAFQDTLVKPGTLLGVAGVSAALGYFLFKTPQPAPRTPGEAPSTTSTAATAAVASTSMAGLVMAFVMRYAMQQLPGIGMGIVRQAMRHRGADGRGQAGSRAPVRPNVTVH